VDQLNSFQNLTPERVMNSVERLGLNPTGRILQLNSYENRVFQIELEDAAPVVTKYYRPGRWRRESIQDEHDFLYDLKNEGIPAVAPLKFEGCTVHDFDSLYMTVFPKIVGKMPEEFLNDELKRVGRRLAQIHNLGSRKWANERLTLGSAEFGDPALEILQNWISPEVRGRYTEAANLVLDALDDALRDEPLIRIHGDCHRGNLLNNGTEFFFVDFDDFCNGPAAQDFWMLLDSVDTEEEKDLLLDGYSELRDLPEGLFDLFEPLRGLRLIHYSGWIARRWSDPSFPRLFPTFQEFNYWAEETEALERIAQGL
jgi:Ser/Thr protein kinase RdoA (MazF antagonist)